MFFFAANYLHWRLVLDFLPETNEKLRKFQKDFHAALHGPGQSTPRWRSCLGKINEPLGFALSAKMIEKAFDHEARTQMEVMIQHLKEAFNSMVDEASWIDQDTRIVVKEKAAAMNHLIAYPDWIMDHQLLDEYYDGVSTIYRLIIKLIDIKSTYFHSWRYKLAAILKMSSTCWNSSVEKNDPSCTLKLIEQGTSANQTI